MSVRYCCSHLEDPHASLPPSYPSSSSSYYPLPSLYFCEECDAIRCNLCVGVEIASYFCPNCLFDVPSASVRADRNRCARNCFSCPRCESSLAVQASEKGTEDGSQQTGPPYVLACAGCKWSSREVGWEFEKPTGLAAQLQRIDTQPEIIQTEFDAIKDHLETYITPNAPAPASTSRPKSKQPSRHISHLTQMAAKALGRDVPGMMGRPKRRTTLEKGKEKAGWDELEPYETKHSCKEHDQLDDGESERARLQMIWHKSWMGDGYGQAKSVLPERIRLQTKLTKRCPESNCRHLLIQPDTKSTRFKIKMVAMSYLPAIELGRRRRRILPDLPGNTPEELEQRRKDRRRTRVPAKEEDEPMSKSLQPGQIYTFQLAFVNPLFDPIQIRLVPSTQRDPHATCSAFVPVPHFTVNALKYAWAYDEEEEEDHGSEEASEEGSSTFSGPTKSSISGPGTMGKRSRLSVLGGLGGSSRKRDHGVERKGNISKVGLEVEVLPDAVGVVEADFEIRYTYRADEAAEGEEKGKEAFKIFTFWVRVNFGSVESH